MTANDITPGIKKGSKGILWAAGALILFLYHKEILETVMDTGKILLWGIPTAIVILSFVVMPTFWKWTFLNFTKAVQWALIKNDPLSYMDRYVDVLIQKIKNLGKSIIVLQGKKNKLDRIIIELQTNIKENKKLGAAALQIGNKSQAALFGTKVAGDNESIELYKPLLDRLTRSLTLMTKLQDNWSYDKENMVYQIQKKRNEYEIIKETVKGLKNAEEMINSDSEEARLYGMSLKALEENVTQKMGYIDDFERRSKSVIEGIDIKKQADQDEGLAMLEQYLNGGELTFGAMLTQDVEYETLPANSSVRRETEFKVLK